MGDGLKRVAKQCGGLVAKDKKQTVTYDANGRIVGMKVGKKAYKFLNTFFSVFETASGTGRSAGASLESKKLDGLKFQVLKVLRKGKDGYGDPPEDMFLCRFETDFEMACWMDEVVESINGQPLVVSCGGVVIREGSRRTPKEFTNG